MKPVDVDVNLANVARRRVNARIGLVIHACIFVIVMTFLVALNLSQPESSFWVKWPLLGWGIGLSCHAVAVIFGQIVGNWREHMIQKEMNRLS